MDILRNFINNRIFSSSKDDIPDSINIFYGLAILSELDLLNKTNLIDLNEIENFIRLDLEKFIPEKLTLNLHSLLCLKILTKFRKILLNEDLIYKSLSQTNILRLENFKPSLDIYNHLSSLRILEKQDTFNNIKTTYINEITSLNISDTSDHNLITESARILLILDLLNLKDNQSKLSNTLLNLILNTTNFFHDKKLFREFNWRDHKLAFKIELEILYWALLASSQYSHAFT
jgi:hypothetical protein